MWPLLPCEAVDLLTANDEDTARRREEALREAEAGLAGKSG